MRQVWIALEAISIENHNNFAKQAALNGKEIRFKNFKEEYEDLNTENAELMKKVIHEASQRKIRELAEKEK
jgi:hypothetical protein